MSEPRKARSYTAPKPRPMWRDARASEYGTDTATAPRTMSGTSRPRSPSSLHSTLPPSDTPTTPSGAGDSAARRCSTNHGSRRLAGVVGARQPVGRGAAGTEEQHVHAPPALAPPRGRGRARSASAVRLRDRAGAAGAASRPDHRPARGARVRGSRRRGCPTARGGWPARARGAPVAPRWWRCADRATRRACSAGARVCRSPGDAQDRLRADRGALAERQPGHAVGCATCLAPRVNATAVKSGASETVTRPSVRASGRRLRTPVPPRS